MFFLFKQLEIFSTINIVGGFYYKFIPITLAIGLSFFLIFVGCFVIKKNTNNYKSIFILLIILFWLPLYFNVYLNNIYDLKINLEMINHSNQEKNDNTICRLDQNQKLEGFLCSIPMFIADVKKYVPESSKIKLVVQPGVEVYFYYDLADSYQLTKKISEADYLLFYFPPDNYYFDDGGFLHKNNEPDNLGRYEIIMGINDWVAIFQKIENK